MSARIANTVADVAAAILAGAILHAAHEGDAEKRWGVIDTTFALDILDPVRGATSDAWVRGTGPDSPPRRFTEEEARKCARGLSGSSWDGTAYEAMEIPSPPVRATVGPRAVVGAEMGSHFACIDWTHGHGNDLVAAHAVPCTDEHGLADCVYEDDHSAFGAALLFVRLVGERAAYAALSEVA